MTNTTLGEYRVLFDHLSTASQRRERRTGRGKKKGREAEKGTRVGRIQERCAFDSFVRKQHFPPICSQENFPFESSTGKKS